jgi:hypothetical protein
LIKLNFHLIIDLLGNSCLSNDSKVISDHKESDK